MEAYTDKCAENQECIDCNYGQNRSFGLFQKFRMWHLKDRKLIFYIKGKDELMQIEVMKERDKGLVCLVQVMICDKRLQVW